MKTITLKTVVIFCFCCVVSMAYAAKDLYISTIGNDENDGLTEETAVKTLGRIHQLIGVGDIIHVNGMIDVSLETKGSAEGTNYQQNNVNGGFFFKAGAWHNSKMIGGDPERDGFTSNGDGRLFRIDGGTHTYENLSFTGGADIGNDGGCGLWLRGSTNTFVNCRFVGNKAVLDAEDPTKFKGTNGRGGAFHIMNGTTSFKNCYFAENANTQGSAIFVQGGTINLSGCIVENHDLSVIAGSTGGAFYIWSSQAQMPVITVDRCVFRYNSVSTDGGAITLNNRNNKENYKTVLTIKNSAFIKNEAFNNGGAFHLNNTRTGTNDTILIANTTLFGNTADKFGGAIYLGQAQPNSIFTMVNSSVIANYTRGNGGYGAGMTVYNTNDKNMLKQIYNCIFDKNLSVSQTIYSDIIYRLPDGVSAPGKNENDEDELTISHTFIGTTLSGNGITASWLTNENYPDNNINYSATTLQGETLVSSYTNAAGIDDDPEFYLQQSDFPAYAVPLKDDAPARTFGNAAYLEQFDILSADQLGKERVVSGNSCVAGATEATQEEVENETFDYPLIAEQPTGSKKTSYIAPNYRLIVSNQTISLSNNELQEVELELYNLSGSLVQTGKTQLSIANIPNGVYIVKVRVAGQSVVQKILKR